MLGDAAILVILSRITRTLPVELAVLEESCYFAEVLEEDTVLLPVLPMAQPKQPEWNWDHGAQTCLVMQPFS
jgi:hypothetical protein